MRKTQLLAGATAALAALSFTAPGIASAQTADKPVLVTVTAKGCEPAEVTVPAGSVTFQILNRSARALEWEILRGVEVVDERENIAPGFRQKLTADLAAGEYQMTCGLLSNARGKLLVLNGDGSRTSAARRPTSAELIGSSAEFRVWQSRLTAEMARDARACQDAAGDPAAVEGRRKAVRLGALKLMAIDGQVRGRVGDVVAAASAEPVSAGTCERLQSAVLALQEAASALSVSPNDLIAGAVKALNSRSFGSGSTDAGRPVDARGLSMTIEGSVKVASLFLPLVQQADAAAGGSLAAVVAGARDAAEGSDHAASAAAATALATELAAVPGRLGL